MNTTPAITPRPAIRNTRDFYGGVVLVALALLAWWGSSGLAGSQGVHFGAGTAPRLLSGLLALLGVGVAVMGLVTDGERVEHYAVRGPLLVTAATLVFAATISSFGLVVASFLTVLVASAASPETRWKEAVIWAAVLSCFCTLLFVHALGLSLPTWPNL